MLVDWVGSNPPVECLLCALQLPGVQGCTPLWPFLQFFLELRGSSELTGGERHLGQVRL